MRKATVNQLIPRSAQEVTLKVCRLSFCFTVNEDPNNPCVVDLTYVYNDFMLNTHPIKLKVQVFVNEIDKSPKETNNL